MVRKTSVPILLLWLREAVARTRLRWQTIALFLYCILFPPLPFQKSLSSTFLTIFESFLLCGEYLRTAPLVRNWKLKVFVSAAHQTRNFPNSYQFSLFRDFLVCFGWYSGESFVEHILLEFSCALMRTIGTDGPFVDHILSGILLLVFSWLLLG